MYVLDLTDMRCRRRLVVYPLKMSELSHPTLMDAVGLATEFKMSYVKSRVGGSVDTMTWVGYVLLCTDLYVLSIKCFPDIKQPQYDTYVSLST